MSTPTSSTILSLTATAVGKIKEFSAADPASAGKSLRIYLEAGGCSGYQYGFMYDSRKENDNVIEQDGLQILVDPQSAELLQGSVVDYKSDLSGEGFAIQNPNVKKSCGCGNSVEV
jgi:iron-sulfur cluster assembly accessory protein